ncbi:hypothetical protein F7725_020168 [Dissostichus mawsoni]|uniref:Uncharacterized protein n=1 Tax=Dissostichus mawsoni TaxID=36200 RepID=A0A7J5YCJ1_DISMA|nr:hypothetical protein F7725_020168 [Dissostichus mawsoni]
MDPVFMLHDGSLKVPNPSLLHRGLYYCLLQHTEGTALWPYELSVGQRSDEEEQEHSGGEERDEFRFRRDVGSLEEMQAGVSDAHFAGAVAASVLLTFVVGFSAGALSMTPVLRPTLPPPQTSEKLPGKTTGGAGNHGLSGRMSQHEGGGRGRGEEEEEEEEEEERRRRRRRRREEEEGGGEEGKGLKGNNEECDGEAKEEQFNHFYRGEDGESQTQTDEDTASKDGEEKEMRKEEEEVEEADREENSSNEDGEEGRGSEEEEEERSRDGEEEDTDSNNDETGRRPEVRSPSTAGPRGARPPPRLKQRSLSLKRLNTIMAAASAESLDTREPGGGEGERLHFHMEI